MFLNINGMRITDDNILDIATDARQRREWSATYAKHGYKASASEQRWKARAREAAVRRFADEIIRQNMLDDCDDIPY